MPGIFTVGRVLFVVIFVLSGAAKLWDINTWAQMIAAKVTIPSALADLAAQAEAATGMKTPQLLTIASGIIEIACGLMIALGFGTRFAALVLMLFLVVATYYMHDFWNQADPERTDNIAHALKNLSIFGGLLVFFSLGSWRPLAEREEHYLTRHEELLREEPAPPR
jgi:uncharacterized membrane protein YphA (DoxX/SURF4 family)